jgi:hypothetical protein
MLNKHHAMTSCVDFLNFRTRLNLVFSLKPRSLYSGKRIPGSRWIGGWLGHSPKLCAMEIRKIFVLPGMENILIP